MKPNGVNRIKITLSYSCVSYKKKRVFVDFTDERSEQFSSKISRRTAIRFYKTTTTNGNT